MYRTILAAALAAVTAVGWTAEVKAQDFKLRIAS